MKAGIYNQDCLIAMKEFPDNFFEYVITSPPYNCGGNHLNGEGKKYGKYSDNLSQEEYFEWQKNLINEMLRVTSKHIFYNIQSLAGNKIALNQLRGYFAKDIKDEIIWNKNHGPPAMEPGVMNCAFEYIIIFSSDRPEKRKFYDANFRGTFNNVLSIKNKHSNEYSGIHKAVMPMDIPRIIMQHFGNEGDKVIDPFLGSGTTAVACIKENRQFWGYEIDKDYFEAAKKRIALEKTKLSLF